MFSRRTAGALLQHIAGESALFPLPTAYVALFTTAPAADDGSGAVEANGGGYARVQTAAASWGPAGAPPPLLANSAAIAFPAATANWGTIVAAGLYDAATGGNLLLWDWLGAHSWRPCTIAGAAPAVVTLPAHGMAAGDALAFTTVFGGAAPSVTQGSLTGLLTAAAPLGNDTFTLLNAGTPVATGGSGNGMLRKVVPQSVPAGVNLVFWAGRMAFFMGGSRAAPLLARAGAMATALGTAATGSGNPPLTADDGASDLTADDGATILTAS